MLTLSEPARSRIQDGIKKYSRIVARARLQGMNHQDTGDIVKAMLGDMMGYDPFFDVTAEVSIRGPYADYAVLLNNHVKLLLVVKSIAVIPNSAHLLRLSGAGAPAYADWVVLTNADTWLCYRLSVGSDRHPELVCKVSLIDQKSLEEKTAAFFLFCKEGMSQDALLHYWEHSNALNPSRIAALLLSDEVISVLRRELQRTANFRSERKALVEILTSKVLRPDVLSHGGHSDSFPRHPQCYAYVGNPNDSDTWRLPYRTAEGLPDADRLISAVSTLNDDPRSLQIPADDIALVKQRLRAAYLELGILEDELPTGLHD